MIELRKVRKTYNGERYILDGLNLKFKAGEYIQIVGKSGSGKSTLLNIMGLLDNAYEGKIIINGQDVSRLSDTHISNIRAGNIGFIFQSYNLINHMTVRENIYLPLLYSKKKFNKEYLDRMDNIMAEFEILKLADTPVQYLSGGEKQRTSIARAVSLDPGIILADEPTGNLDSGNSSIIFDNMKIMAKKGKLVILVTHNIHDDLGSDKILTLQNGVLN